MKNKFFLFFIYILFFISCSVNKKDIVSNIDYNNYIKNLEAKTEETIGTELTLKECLEIVLKNNLNIRAREIEYQIAKLDKKISFANFLPQINLNFSYRNWKQQPETLVSSGTYRAMQDKSITDYGMEIKMPLFVPATWFLYSAFSQGEQISEIVLDYTKQMITLETIILFYDALKTEATINYITSQINAAKSILNEFEEYYKEGLLLDWQLEEFKTYLFSQYVELNRLKRNESLIKSQLLTNMGLSPFKEIRLKYEENNELKKESLENLIIEALKNNPQTKIIAKNIDIAQDKIKIAISNFLPSLFSFVNISHTSNSYTKYATQTISGLSGIMTIFNGFANVYEYQKAKKTAEEYYLKQEETILKVMIQVLEAYNNLQTVEDYFQLTGKSLDTEEMKLKNIKEKYKENLISLSELLQTIARRDNAFSNFITMKFNREVAKAALNTALGKINY
ncbi:MAG TPA: TolC family protein [bacterium]|nr:TolC family protein [bacterium]HOL48019.1 TolC family protein [bacterium]HPQ19567.1 TolC family protein [bacterium]